MKRPYLTRLVYALVILVGCDAPPAPPIADTGPTGAAKNPVAEPATPPSAAADAATEAAAPPALDPLGNELVEVARPVPEAHAAAEKPTAPSAADKSASTSCKALRTKAGRYVDAFTKSAPKCKSDIDCTQSRLVADCAGQMCANYFHKDALPAYKRAIAKARKTCSAYRAKGCPHTPTPRCSKAFAKCDAGRCVHDRDGEKKFMDALDH